MPVPRAPSSCTFVLLRVPIMPRPPPSKMERIRAKRQLAEAAASKAAKKFKKVRDLRAAARAGKAAAKRTFKENYEYDMLRFQYGVERAWSMNRAYRASQREDRIHREITEIMDERERKRYSRKCSDGEVLYEGR